MVDDVMPITGGSHRVGARLCNFKTGFSIPLSTHKSWLDQNVKPVVQALSDPWVEVLGYASRLGSTQSNLALSQRRCDAVRAHVATYRTNLNFKVDQGLGEDGPDDEANDDGYYRAVEIRIFTAQPPPRPRIPRKPVLSQTVGSTQFKIRCLGGIATTTAGQGDLFLFEIVDTAANQNAFFRYKGIGPAIPLPSLRGAGTPGPFVQFSTSVGVSLSDFEGDAAIAFPPSVSIVVVVFGNSLFLTIKSKKLLSVGAVVRPGIITMSMGFTAGLGLTLFGTSTGTLKQVTVAGP